ncbi:thermonuclease family protein [Sulfitobacter sp. F26169L]|uniref:thermonuclease family protein n=1 Tax=Sulfitobacter sp. F26169L TaxID=2996015 RepID=UPI002260A47A|nr:thermonuclease family protein [Sulfitobacter sp. F26169L]MCX7564811.1 thermonuclease family protein [Sulfitobacter sp. F26169L]
MADSFSYFSLRWRLVVLAVFACAAVWLSGGVLRANMSEGGLSGPIRVIDGDTFEVAGTTIRLHAIDAVENDQMCRTQQGKDWACGGWVTKVVKDRYSGAIARCEAVDIDRYGRTVARCSALGEDVGAWLVREGMAFAYVEYGDDYVAIERSAAAVNRGLHAVRVQTPSEHRKSRVKRISQRPPSDGKCVIKGNISADGERIYHQPGQRFYARTRINIAKGERWFCSAGAAQAAGWRPAQR